MSKSFSIVYRSHDPVEAEMIEDVLGQEGLYPHLIGTRSSALLGVSQYIIDLRIEVPNAAAPRARGIINELLGDSHSKIDLEATENDQDDEDRSPETPGKSRVIAAGLVFVIPGGSHFYVGRPWTAVVLILVFFAAFAVLLSGEAMVFGSAMLCGEFIADLFGGQLAISKINSGQRRGKGAQLLAGKMKIR